MSRARYTRPIFAQLALAATLSAVWLLASFDAAHAASSGMPWEAPLQRILESIEGPVAKVIAVVVIIVTGLSLSFGDMGGGFRRMVQVVSSCSLGMTTPGYFASSSRAIGSFSRRILSGSMMNLMSQSRSRRSVTPHKSGPTRSPTSMVWQEEHSFLNKA